MYTSLAVLAGPAAEPVSLDLLRQHVRVDHTDDDMLLQLYASSARNLAENYLGRMLCLQRLRYSLADGQPSGSWGTGVITPIILPQWLTFQTYFRSPMQLPRGPVHAVERVAVSVGGQIDDTVLNATTDYSVDLATSPARLLLAASALPHAGQHVSIDFVAGFDSSTELLPPMIANALLFGAAWLYEHRGDDEAADLPNAFYALLTPYRQVTFG